MGKEKKYSLNGKKVKVFISKVVCDEAVINIKTKKFEQLSFLNYLINKSTILPDMPGEIKNELIQVLPLNDKIILSTAISHKMDFFLTGNKKDFEPLYFKKIHRTLILKPADFIYLRFHSS